MNHDEEIEIDLLELLYYLRAKLRWLILAFILGAMIAGGFTYYFVTPKYTATSKIYMVSASSSSVLNLTDLNLGTSLSADYAELIKLRPVFNEVIAHLELDYTYEQLLSQVTISKVGDTRILKVSVENEDPKLAQEIANELADVAVTYIPEVMETSTPNIAEYAILPQGKSSPNITKNTLIGGILLLLVLAAIYVVRFLMDDTVKSADEVEKAFGVMPLTVIPEGQLENIADEVEHHSSKKKKKKKKPKKKEPPKKGNSLRIEKV